MTKQEVLEKTGENVYAIWLRLAMRDFIELDPSQSFVTATNFIKELLKQHPEF